MHDTIDTELDTELEAPKRYQCRHIFTDGRRCGSPSLRNQPLCYYHHNNRLQVEDPRARKNRRATFHLPLPEDQSAIQHSIGQVLQRIASNDIDPRRAGLLLYGLQIASLNLPKPPASNRHPKSSRESQPQPQSEIVEEITLDPELGPLAPETEFTRNQRRKSPVEILMEKMFRDDEEEKATKQKAEKERAKQTTASKPTPAQPITLPAIQATAATTRPRSCHFDSELSRMGAAVEKPASPPQPSHNPTKQTQKESVSSTPIRVKPQTFFYRLRPFLPVTSLVQQPTGIISPFKPLRLRCIQNRIDKESSMKDPNTLRPALLNQEVSR